MRLGRGAILRSYHQMGLCRTKSPPLHAGVRPQSPHPLPTPPPAKRQDQPYPHVKPNYGAKKQYSQEEDDSPALSKAGKKIIQEVCGVFLFLARAVDGGLLPALSSLASQQAKPTERTMELCKKFLDFMSCQEEAVLTYRASDMVLAIHSDASYRCIAIAMEIAIDLPAFFVAVDLLSPTTIAI